jgi:hypothetical protein
MMKGFGKYRGVFFAIIVAGLLGWAFLESPASQLCVAVPSQKIKDEHPPKNTGIILFPLLRMMGHVPTTIRCFGSFIASHDANISADFTIILGLATLLLWGATRDLVDGAEITAERQLRAYIFVGEMEVTGAGTPKAQVVIKITNTGQTPGYDVTVSTASCTFDVPGEITFDPTAVGPDSSRFVLGPRAGGQRNIPLGTHCVTHPEHIAAMKAGKGVLYVWGEILYRDAFNKSRYTRFRHMIGGSVGWPDDGKVTVCPEGNEAD